MAQVSAVDYIPPACRQCIANVLFYSMQLIMVLHSHIFFLLGLPLYYLNRSDESERQQRNKRTAQIIMWIPGSLTTPIIVVIIMNIAFEMYSEFQPWQIAYIAWGICVGTLLIISHIYYLQRPVMMTILLIPFGFEKKRIEEMAEKHLVINVILPLIASAPAIIVFFIADYIMNEKLVLQCDKAYAYVSDFCEG